MEEEDRPAVGGSGPPNREREAVRRDVVLIDHSAVLIGPAPVVTRDALGNGIADPGVGLGRGEAQCLLAHGVDQGALSDIVVGDG